MAQVSYGTITITDTTDLTTYIRYATKAPLTAASQFQETPTTDTRYIAVLSIPTSDSIPAWNSSSWKWSEFIGTDGLSVKNTRVLYYLKTNSANVPQVDKNTSIVSTDTQNAWTSKNPTYVANGTYWTCLEVTLSDNTTKSWSTPTEDLGLTQTAKDTAEAKSIAQQTIEDSQGALSIATGINQHFFSIPSDYSASVPAGSYITEINISEFKQSPSGGNLLTRSDGVWLRNGADILASLQGTGLTFLIPTGTYKGRKSLEILGGTSPALKLYDAQNNSAVATLNSNGLVLSKGGIEIGGVTSGNGYVYLSTLDKTGITINGHTPGTNDPKWRAIIGSNFGVDSAGNLYAKEAHISGAITATSGTIGGWSIGTDTNKSLYTGNFGEDGGIYISPSYTGILTISGEESQNWAFTAGNAFGVTTDGKLYATGVEIAGGTLSELLTAVSGGYHAFVTSTSGGASEDIDVIIDEELFLEQIEPIVEAAVSSDQSAPIVGQYYFSKSGSVWSLENSIIERRTVDLASFGIIVEDNTITQFYVIVESVMGLAEESAQLQENFSRIEEQKDIIENNLSTLTTDIDDIQNKQTTTDNTLNSVNNRLGVAENNINIMGPVVEKINKRISINPEVPSITIQASDGTETKSVVITDDQVQFKSGSSIQAYAGGENFVAPSLQTTQILMRTKVSGTLTGGLGFIMRSNGHLSIKRITGGE